MPASRPARRQPRSIRPARRQPRSILPGVDAALHAYAARGVFRGLSGSDGPRGSRRYRFLWLTRRPMVLVVAPSSRTLTFVDLFPAVTQTPGVAVALKRALAAAATTAVPAHRRLDRRRVTMAGRIRGDDLSLRATVGAGDGSAAVRAALAVVNDLFLVMHECFPEYLVAHFGVSDE